ncbi:MAG: acyltransferase family protein, partial [Flavobacteriaceae bacterium]|nr:acyltransferase family protein [Flavobacteriaceae bacterium]
MIFPDEESGFFFLIRFLGTLGVDLFFVLSGFLIGGLILRQIESGKTSFRHFLYFWIRRWFKTLPNYFLILFLNIVLLYYLYTPDIDGIGKYFLFLQNFSSEMPDFFTESWSLSIEEFSYLLGPFLIFLLLFFNVKNKKAVFLGVSIIVIAVGILNRYSFHLNQELSNYLDWSHNLRKVVIYRIDSIYYGFIGA